MRQKETRSRPRKRRRPAAEKEAKKGDAEAADKGTKTADVSPVTVAGNVMLGSPDLTAGIPGEGELTLAQIKAWYDDPKNTASFRSSFRWGSTPALPQAEKAIEEHPLSRGLIELGRQLYFDKRLSVDNTVSCASCHDPEQGFAAHTQFGVGVNQQTGGRNSQSLTTAFSAVSNSGMDRAASLEEQAKGPIANPIEMANTHEETIVRVKKDEGYRYEFDKVFGGKDGGQRQHRQCGHGYCRFRACFSDRTISVRLQRAATGLRQRGPGRLEGRQPGCVRRLRAGEGDAEAHPMSESAKRGRDIFFSDKGSCTACHVGANLSDELFHNLGVGMDKEKPDLGRYDVTKEDKDKGAFKTPTVRNVALSGPYMHDGSHKTLEEVVAW